MQDIVHSADPAVDDLAIDALVASYATLGAAHRRRQRGRRALFAAAGAALAVAAVLATRADWSGFRAAAAERFMRGGEVGALQALVTEQLESLGDERRALQADRAWFEERRAELAQQFAELERRSGDLEMHRLALETQSAELAAAMTALESERQALVEAAALGPSLDDELAVVAAERRALDERWREFDAEDDALAAELDSLNTQREVLETERAQMEQQRRELEALLDAAMLGDGVAGERSSAEGAADEAPYDDGLPGEPASSQRGRGVDAASPAVPSSTAGAAGETRVAMPPRMRAETLAAYSEAVREGDLAEMRAGVQLGDGLNITLGLTRSASVNGVEQVQNSFTLEGLGTAVDLAAIGQTTGLILQNGPGNEIGSGVLDALSSGFGTVIQNTLDDQSIRTQTVLDIGIHDVSNVIDSIATGNAIADSLRVSP